VVENVVSGSSYQTLDIDGTTVYRYGNNATWISGGILYTINGSVNLSNEQVTKIVRSV
jgi:hypothetical protein